MAGLCSAVTSHVNRALTALTTDLLALLARYDRDSDQQRVGDNAARVTRRGAPAISRSAPTPREDVTRSSSLGSGNPCSILTAPAAHWAPAAAIWGSRVPPRQAVARAPASADAAPQPAHRIIHDVE